MKLGTIAAASFVLATAPSTSGAQQPGIRAVTRSDVIEAALARGSRIALARADSTTARGEFRLARQYDNPTVSAGYSKSIPQQHFSLDIPLDYPWLRRPRIGAAASGLVAARYRFDFERAAVTFDAETTYTNALAAARRAVYSRETAREADSVLTLARIRRDAGDGSELDVQLAAVSGGQLTNAAARDSLDAISSLLAVQAVMGLPSDEPAIALADALDAGAVPAEPAAGTQLLVAAAEDDLRSAEQSLVLQRRLMFSAASLSLGWESRDPTGVETGVLPTISVAVPLPLFNRNDGGVLQAEAQRDRAQAALNAARLEGAQQAARARRELTAALDRLARGDRLVTAADSVARLSLLAYQEGASSLPNVLEAQRTARETLSQHVDDLAAARNAAAIVRLLTLTVHRNDQ